MNLGDLTKLAEFSSEISNDHVHYLQASCTTSRNRSAKCQACLEVCPTGALTLNRRKRTIEINKALCCGCNSCTTVCPTQALASVAPTDKELEAFIAQTTVASEGIACFVCGRKASKRDADPDLVTEVVCLSRVDESLLVGLAAHGAQRIVLVDGDCATCKYHQAGALADRITDAANEILVSFANAPLVERTMDVPEECKGDLDSGAIGRERRNLFSHSKGYAGTAAKKTASLVIKQTTGIDVDKKVKGLATQHPQPTRHDDLLDAMGQLAEADEPEEAILSTHHFGSVSIDASLCSGCKRCGLFCPVKALQTSKVERTDGDGSYLEFDASKCNRCNLCADLCAHHCLTVSDAHLSEVFDFEPRLIPIPLPVAFRRTSNDDDY